MSVRYVKNTMLMHVAELLAPHYCIACGALRGFLCERCIDDIVTEPLDGCVICRQPATGGVCGKCCDTFEQAWCAGDRRDALRSLLDVYKYRHARAAHLSLATILAEALPHLPQDIIISSVPTITPHIRRRGYDHVELIAKEVARHKVVAYRRLLRRTDNSVQVGKNRAVREAQARTAFQIADSSLPEVVLLIDDVITTGATLRHAARVLRENGVRRVWVAAVARQPLDA